MLLMMMLSDAFDVWMIPASRCMMFCCRVRRMCGCDGVTRPHKKGKGVKEKMKTKGH